MKTGPIQDVEPLRCPKCGSAPVTFSWVVWAKQCLTATAPGKPDSKIVPTQEPVNARCSECGRRVPFRYLRAMGIEVPS